MAYAVNPDGSHPHRLFDQPMECPHWSPDGTQVASCGAPAPDNTTILTVDTGATRFLPPVAPNLFTPCYVWSTDGTRLACEGFNDDNPALNGIFTVRVADWGDVQRLTPLGTGGGVPGDYSPNSRRLVFGRGNPDGTSGVYRVNANGTGLRRLTPPSLITGSPGSWSPVGNQILFSARVDPDHRQSVYVMHSDGSGLHRLAIPGIACGGPFDDPESVSCADPTWSPSGLQIAFRTIRATGTALWRAEADGTHATFLVDMGFDSGESIDWGTHPLATHP